MLDTKFRPQLYEFVLVTHSTNAIVTEGIKLSKHKSLSTYPELHTIAELTLAGSLKVWMILLQNFDDLLRSATQVSSRYAQVEIGPEPNLSGAWKFESDDVKWQKIRPSWGRYLAICCVATPTTVAFVWPTCDTPETQSRKASPFCENLWIENWLTKFIREQIPWTRCLN